MGAFFIYILKSSLCLALFYLFYRLLLSRETFHRFNRIALLGLALLSLTIPFVQISVKEPVIMQETVLNLEQLLLMATMLSNEAVADVATTPLWIRLVLWFYIGGVLFFAGHFFYGIFRIYRMICQGKITQLENGVRLVITDQPVSPFSWMKYIVISTKDMEEGADAIITHEMAHISKRHSIDLFLIETGILFHWFNPAVWLLKQELQTIHEYEADESVITQGIDAKKYQLLLIKKAVGSQRFTSMANSFNHSSLKKRISMMLKGKSNPWARLKYLYVLPLAAFTVAAFARPEISRELDKISNVKISEIIPVIDTETAKSMETPVITAISAEKNTEKTVKQKTESKPDTATVGRIVATYRVVKDSSIIIPKSASVKNVDPKVQAAEKQLKDSTAVRIYKGEIKKDSTATLRYAVMRDTTNSHKVDSINDVQLYVKPFKEGEEPLILLDGEEIEDVSKVHVYSIESFRILKDKAATDKYGEKGKNGVIIITSKKNVEE